MGKDRTSDLRVGGETVESREKCIVEEKISIVIPCYRSEKMIATVVEEIISYVEQWNYEIILVCDCSPDNVWEEIKKLQQKHDTVQGILFSKNFGQHAATLAGYRHATGDIIVTMDDDGQSDPEAISRMIDKLHEGYDVVYAKYPVYEKSPFRIFGSWINKKMAEILTGKPSNIQGNSFYAMRKFVKEEMTRYTNSFPYLGGLVFRTTSSIAEVDVSHRGRKEGTSGYTIGKLVKLWINGFTAFSVLPLRIASLTGFFFSALGFVLGVILVIRKIINPAIILGYTSMMVAIFFLGGIILLAVGLIGEYVGRIYIGQNQSPQYVIKETTWKVTMEQESIDGTADH